MSSPDFTAEQRAAIDRRDGDLLLEASAGSGKTSVLVERFTRAVAEDGVAVGAILAITFTEKAAAELRERIRGRFRALGLVEAGRATEGAFISTIHGFCARILRTHALAAGLDPLFEVLDETASTRLAGLAFERALATVGATDADAAEMIAAYSPDVLQDTIIAVHGELRARGERAPGLPPDPPAPELGPLRARLRETAEAAARELGAIAEPGAKVLAALAALERCDAVLGEAAEPWPGGLGPAALGRGGKALESDACVAYVEALEAFRAACAARRAGPVVRFLDRLLRGYGAAYRDLKRERAAVDFEDLELLARDLLRDDAALRERVTAGFTHVMVDELQDTNRVQLDLIELVCRGNLFTVGDAQQSIYGFRHADVALFEELGSRRRAAGRLATLTVNFRSRPELIAALNRAFEAALGERFRPLRAGREAEPVDEPVVELILCDRGGAWGGEGRGAAWRFAEAAALAERVAELVSTGAVSPGEIVLLTRAGTDLRTYERALEDRGVPTYLIGGRGYWSHPQVVDLVAYLRALANPLDEDALFTVLGSPLGGLTLDGLVVLVGLARELGVGVWELADSRQPRLAQELSANDLAALERFAGWFGHERARSVHLGVHALVDRALRRSGYELAILALPGGVRRMANVRKLMRLGREYEADAGPDLRGFLDLVHARGLGEDQSGGEPDPRESEAPVESEGLDAVRLMTSHRAKGLEFPVVCVADLGRGPVYDADVVRVGSDGRIGVRLEQPGTAGGEPALDLVTLRDEQRARDGEEERRLFYVAMTRAQERLILSGAAKFGRWESFGRSPVAWIAPAFVPDVAERALGWIEGEGAGGGRSVEVTGEGVRLELRTAEPAVDPEVAEDPAPPVAGAPAPVPAVAGDSDPVPVAAPALRVSYSALAEHARCGFRYYVERVLGIPGVDPVPDGTDNGRPAALSGARRGTIVHAVLAGVDYRRPVPVGAAAVAEARGAPIGDVEALDGMIAQLLASPLAERLAAAGAIRTEERFAFLLASARTLVTGAFDVLARESDGTALVVDYKTDELRGEDPVVVVERDYLVQRQVYGLAALGTGAAEAEVVHVFLAAPERPVSARFSAAAGDEEDLRRQLAPSVEAIARGDFTVTPEPQRAVCAGCPAEGGLCSWPVAMTRRASTDRLF